MAREKKRKEDRERRQREHRDDQKAKQEVKKGGRRTRKEKTGSEVEKAHFRFWWGCALAWPLPRVTRSHLYVGEQVLR